jgi:osomolarity two-component system response regulator SKN7
MPRTVVADGNSSSAVAVNAGGEAPNANEDGGAYPALPPLSNEGQGQGGKNEVSDDGESGNEDEEDEDEEGEEGDEDEEGEEEEEEERVMPSPVNAAFEGRTTLPSIMPPSSSSKTRPTTKSSCERKSTSPSTTSPRTTTTSPSDGKNKTRVGVRGKKMLRVRRSTFVPGWAVPPRVLLVDDDIVSRKLGKKFLQVFGCTIDVAVDGVSAVNKMNLEKYDLVLMVSFFSVVFEG